MFSTQISLHRLSIFKSFIVRFLSHYKTVKKKHCITVWLLRNHKTNAKQVFFLNANNQIWSSHINPVTIFSHNHLQLIWNVFNWCNNKIVINNNWPDCFKFSPLFITWQNLTSRSIIFSIIKFEKGGTVPTLRTVSCYIVS